ncbi:MAG: cell wall-binding repeat-containing protein [Acidimicrobiales bacterium]
MVAGYSGYSPYDPETLTVGDAMASGVVAGYSGYSPYDPSTSATLDEEVNPASTSPSVTHLAGSNRDATAIAVTQGACPSAGSAKAVVLARNDVFADALSGGPLAAKLGGPLMLSGPPWRARLEGRAGHRLHRVPGHPALPCRRPGVARPGRSSGELDLWLPASVVTPGGAGLVC